MVWCTSCINYPLPTGCVFLEGRTACFRMAEHHLLMTDKCFILQDCFQYSCHHKPLTLQHCLRAGKTPIIILLILCSLQYSCLENPMNGGAWQAAVHRIAKSRTRLSDFTFTHWRRIWQPTPGFLPGESQRQRSLVGCRLWGRTVRHN